MSEGNFPDLEDAVSGEVLLSSSQTTVLADDTPVQPAATPSGLDRHHSLNRSDDVNCYPIPIKSRTRGYLAVFDIVAAWWCEQRVSYSLINGRDPGPHGRLPDPSEIEIDPTRPRKRPRLIHIQVHPEYKSSRSLEAGGPDRPKDVAAPERRLWRDAPSTRRPFQQLYSPPKSIFGQPSASPSDTHHLEAPTLNEGIDDSEPDDGVQTEEDRFAKILVDQMTKTLELLDKGFCYDFPVFAVVDDMPIIGSINKLVLKKPEIKLEDLTMPKGTDNSVLPCSDGEVLDQPPPSSQPDPAAFTLSMSSITPTTSGISALYYPRQEYQAGLYNHLLTLMVTSLPFDFDTLCSKHAMHLDRATPLSSSFLDHWAVQIQNARVLLAPAHQLSSSALDDGTLTLDDLFQLWNTAMTRAFEECDVSKKVNLIFVKSPRDASISNLESTPSGETSGDRRQLRTRLATKELDTLELITFRRVRISADDIRERIFTALQYWRGYRSPEGVELKDTARCNECRYRSDCVWRVKKAEEANTSLQKRKASQVNL